MRVKFLKIIFVGKAEAHVDALQSVLAIHIYRRKIDDLKELGEDAADFDSFLYQPEKDERGEYIHHREDHNHLLKRIVACLHDGRIPGVDLRCLRDALHDANTGLTYEALTGKNKQSVPDCELVVGPGVISFLKGRGDAASTVKVLQIIHNWHKAVDGRGLSEGDRARFCNEMKEWILEDWMSWFKWLPEYRFIDINRYKLIDSLTERNIKGRTIDLTD